MEITEVDVPADAQRGAHPKYTEVYEALQRLQPGRAVQVMCRDDAERTRLVNALYMRFRREQSQQRILIYRDGPLALRCWLTPRNGHTRED